eukprot:2171647-Amphidinium_carterae.1
MSVLEFERARYSAASASKRAEVCATISKILAAADAHVAMLHAEASNPFVQRWQGLRDELVNMVVDTTAVHPLPFQQLRGGGGGYISDMMASMVDSFGNGGQVQRAEMTEALSNLAPHASWIEAAARIQRWDESLVDDAVQFGTVLQPFQ